MSDLQKRILVVDDEPCVAALLARYCRNQRCDVRDVGSAEEAIGLVGRESFDLIILDIVLPGLSGFNALRVLKGALDLIGKPVEFQKLSSILRALPPG